MLGPSPAAEDIIASAVLVVSELVANAIRSNCATVILRVELHRDHIRLSVQDDAPSGHGLTETDDARRDAMSVVDQFTRNWGVQPIGEDKLVWAILGVPPELTSGMRCTVSTML
jgi:anti-sigma regulatory factor (Ser/Thr protein kinase)